MFQTQASLFVPQDTQQKEHRNNRMGTARAGRDRDTRA
ncbi:hypothetical protein TCSYLVIO_000257, partial [Trypanosoma cruzi]